MIRLAAIILAAGAASRYRAGGGRCETKLVDAFAGEPLVRHAVRAASAAGAETVVVTGHALAADVEVAVVLLADMPKVGAGTIRALAAAAEAHPEAQAVVPVADGLRGNPVLLRRALFSAACALSGDEGARRLLRDPAVVVTEVPMAGDAIRFDVDEASALAAGDALAGPPGLC